MLFSSTVHSGVVKGIRHWQLLQVHNLACSFGGQLEQAAGKISAANSTETSGTSAAEALQLPWERSSHCLLLSIRYSSSGIVLSTTRCSLTNRILPHGFKNLTIWQRRRYNYSQKTPLAATEKKEFSVSFQTLWGGLWHHFLRLKTLHAATTPVF